ncbi:unnamed protein product [Brachionus calyciflorus]|uniref:Uncharacterized protein n=1 Tax=Brachionus calyciflorus TaxID=104777 RepID=A0A814Q752_9BILA|nr:unnamed protein product [Brachionus calyciflorus]
MSNLLRTNLAAIEIYVCLTHFFVLMGIRNSPLCQLGHNSIYFMIDALLTGLSVYQFKESEVGFFILTNWIFMFWMHLYYVYKMTTLNSINNLNLVFPWSCTDFGDYRFSRKYWFEIFGTTLDVLSHGSSAWFNLKLLESEYWFFAFLTGILITYSRVFAKTKFTTEQKMMPVFLGKLYRVLL